MARSFPARRGTDLLIVDGFAGPGRYIGGEDGSPIIMLKAFLEHQDRSAIERTMLRYVFIENHRKRFEHLQHELDAIRPTLPPNVRVIAIPGEYGDVMPALLSDTSARVPTFAFIDPFGYAGTKLTLTNEILGFPRCEALIYLPTRILARFVGHPDTVVAFDHVYGSREWEGAIDLEFDRRITFLRDRFERALNQSAAFTRRFEIVTESGGGYDLYFGSNNELGLVKMKEAMWKVDPIHGRAYRHIPTTPQTTLFADEPDTVPLQHALRIHFGLRPFTVEEAERFVTLSTDFLADAHLKKRTLAPLEEAGRIAVERTGRKGSWKGATVRFLW